MPQALSYDVEHPAGRPLYPSSLVQRCSLHQGAVSARVKRKQIRHLNGSAVVFGYKSNRPQNSFNIVELADVKEVLLGLGIMLVPSFDYESGAFGIRNSAHFNIGQEPVDY